MKIKLIELIMLLLPIITIGQNISVQSFKHLPNDMDARVNHPKTDQNGDKCAIIKVVTTEQGFTWEGDMFGIVATEHKTAEYWLYVPHGAKRLTIKHPQLGILRDYIYTESIKEANVYEMVLSTGKVTTIIEDVEIPMQWLVIKSEPSEADVFIDNQYVGVTPFQKRMQIGSYDYRIEKFMYHSTAGKLELKVEDRETIDVSLKPAFGYLSITSEPEGGAKIEIDGKPIEGETPLSSYQLLSGNHRITLKKLMFDPKVMDIEIKDDVHQDLTIDMVPTFATINIQTLPSATVFIDGLEVGQGNYNGRLTEGLHSLEAKLKSHKSDRQQIEVEKGENKEFELTPIPISGVLDVVSTPMDANIIIDGQDYGKTPKTIQELLIGDHELEIKKQGYKSVLKTIAITENNTTEIIEELEKNRDYSTQQTMVSANNRTASKNIFKDARDGQEYEIVVIGNQTWFAENLNYEMENSWCYDNKAENCSKYGRLYTWDAAMQACPSGWHLASDDEWKKLEMYLGMTQTEANNTYSRGTEEGKKMKSITGWKNNGNGTNSSGFNALPGGGRDGDGSFYYLGDFGSWWSSSESSSSRAWLRNLYYDYDQVYRYYYNKTYGRSVRCLKN